MRSSYCDCGKLLTGEESFEVESNVRGRLDQGYICDNCGVAVWTYKLEPPNEDAEDGKPHAK